MNGIFSLLATPTRHGVALSFVEWAKTEFSGDGGCERFVYSVFCLPRGVILFSYSTGVSCLLLS
jgi:hypothetical protein